MMDQIIASKMGGNHHLGVSENSGTPKSSILIGFPIKNHPFWGTSIFGNPHFHPLKSLVLWGFLSQNSNSQAEVPEPTSTGDKLFGSKVFLGVKALKRNRHSKKVTTHPWSTPQAIPLPNYERIPFTTYR